MYITRVDLENVKSFEKLVWKAPKDQLAGWHVILGDNGSGKSTFLRAIALAFSGPTEAYALRQDWNTWIRHGAQQTSIQLEISHDPQYDYWTGTGRTAKGALTFGIEIKKQAGSPPISIQPIESSIVASRHVWGDNYGWFSAGFGPFRRFSGGNKDYEKLFYTNERLARHLSAFGEDVALTEAISWLRELRFKQLENKPEGKLLTHIVDFVNQPGFLPHNASLTTIDSEHVVFKDGNGVEISVQDLSDGYRSILSLTFELIRQMAFSYGTDGLFSPDDPYRITAPGVVLIDEIDVHLHPSWQRRIGSWFRQCFPNVQFIVTTHSPLVCQAAEIGSIWNLPTPGTGEKGQRVEGAVLQRLLFGDILQAYGSGLFGIADRSDVAKEKLQKLTELNKKAHAKNISPEEEYLRAEIRSELGIAPD